MRRSCPVPCCTGPVPEADHSVFCLDHYYQLPQRVTGDLFRLQFVCSRTENEDDRQHLKEQIAGYVSAAVRQLTDGAARAPQA